MSFTPPPNFIYLLPGRHRALEDGLGQALMQRGQVVAGRALVGDFVRLRFSEQVAVVAGDLRALAPQAGGRVLAYSFGAYLFLHALAQLPPFAGRALLLSPVVGEAAHTFVPPSAGRLQQWLAQGQYPLPARMELHVGDADWQCPLPAVQALGDALGARTVVVPGAGHALPREYVGAVLDAWLAQV